MYKTSIKYVNLNNEKQVKQLAFQLTTQQIAELSEKYGEENQPINEYAQEVVHSGNPFRIIKFLSDVVLAAYGVPSADGEIFDKNPTMVARFRDSVAYAEYVELLVTTDGAAMEFSNNVLNTGKLQAAAQEAQAKQIAVVPDPVPTLPSSLSQAAEGLPPEVLAQVQALLAAQNNPGTFTSGQSLTP